MTITYPISFPSSPGIAKVKMTMESVVGVSESPFTLEQQTYAHQGQRWRAVITMPVMRRAQAAGFIAAMAKLNGRQGTFLLGDPDAKTPRGTASGVPVVNGAGQTGNSLITKGWTPSISNIMRAGDYFQLGTAATSRLYMILDDANSDGSGFATFNIWPNLRATSVDNDPLTIHSAKTQFRLDAPFSWDADEVSTFSINLSATESL